MPGDLDNFIYSIQDRMAEFAEQKGLVLACGPTPFMQTVQKFAAELGVRCQLSLENRMACGVGACLGCVSKTTENWPVPAKRGGQLVAAGQLRCESGAAVAITADHDLARQRVVALVVIFQPAFF